MKYELAIEGVNASQVLDPENPIWSENPDIVFCAQPVIYKKRWGTEHVVLFKTDSRPALEKEFRKILSFLRKDKLKELSDLFLIIVVFPNIDDDFFSSIVLTSDILEEIAGIGLTLEFICYRGSRDYGPTGSRTEPE